MLYALVAMEVINEKEYEHDCEVDGDNAQDVFDYIETFPVEGLHYAPDARFSDLLPDEYILTSDYYDEPLVTRGSFEYEFVISPHFPNQDMDIRLVITDEFELLGEKCGRRLPLDLPYCVWCYDDGCVYLVVDSNPETIGEAARLIQKFEKVILDCAWQRESWYCC